MLGGVVLKPIGTFLGEGRIDSMNFQGIPETSIRPHAQKASTDGDGPSRLLKIHDGCIKLEYCWLLLGLTAVHGPLV